MLKRTIATVLVFIAIISILNLEGETVFATDNSNIGTNILVPETFSKGIAIKEDGTVWTWGQNTHGQLGNGEYTDSSSPVQMKNMHNAIAVATGLQHKLILKADGTVWAVGSCQVGQLGNSGAYESNIALQVEGLSDVVAIASGLGHCLALKSDGTVWSWGSNSSGQLGIGGEMGEDGVSYLPAAYSTGCEMPPTELTPVKIETLSDIVAISAEGNASAALKNDGTVWTWGEKQKISANPSLNKYGRIIGGGSDVKTADGKTWVKMNEQDYYQITACINNSNFPIKINGLTNVRSIAIWRESIYALKSDGTLWVWGNVYGSIFGVEPISTYIEGIGDVQIDTTPFYRDVPTQLRREFNNTISISGAVWVKNNGSVWITSWGEEGILEETTENINTIYTSNAGMQLKGLTDILAIAYETDYGLALKKDGTLWSWGMNFNGRLGQGKPTTGGGTSQPIEKSLGKVNLDNVKLPSHYIQFSKITSDDTYKIYIDGTLFDTSSNTFNENGTIMVPMNALLDFLGYTSWRWTRPREQLAIYNSKEPYLWLDVTIGSKSVISSITVDKKNKIELASAPKIVDGVIMVPLRSFAELKGYKVDWNAQNKTIIVHK